MRDKIKQVAERLSVKYGIEENFFIPEINFKINQRVKSGVYEAIPVEFVFNKQSNSLLKDLHCETFSHYIEGLQKVTTDCGRELDTLVKCEYSDSIGTLYFRNV